MIAYDESGKTLFETTGKEYLIDDENKITLLEFDKEINNPLGFKPKLERQNGFITCQLDNVISVALALDLIEQGFDGNAIFPDGEEAGLSYKPIMNHMNSEGLDNLITLDISPSANNDESYINKGMLAFRYGDSYGTFNENETNKLVNIAETSKIPFMIKDEFLKNEHEKKGKEGTPRLGKTELGKVISESNKISGTSIQVLYLNNHSNEETLTEESLENYKTITEKYLTS